MQATRARTTRLPRSLGWRLHALRATLWFVPSLQVAGAALLFWATLVIDRASYTEALILPSWVSRVPAEAARTILTAIAASVITVAGLVFSITIVALTLASTQFGPRMLRNFTSDRGTQITLGSFVASFVYIVLTLGAVSPGSRGDFVPHLSITLSMAAALADIGVLIYFIHHIAASIQLPEVIASIARDLNKAIEAESGSGEPASASGPSEQDLAGRMAGGTVVVATRSGYLQLVGYPILVTIAERAGGVVQMLHRPGHFVTQNLPLANVWPSEAAPAIAQRLERAHVTGAHRTLAQDPAYAIDQLAEIAIRALSPAVNDTFTALTCIDWLGDGLCKLTSRMHPASVHRDGNGKIRVMAFRTSYRLYVEHAFDKIRQASSGMPAVMIRQLEAIARILRHATDEEQREALAEQAGMIMRACERTVPEPLDRDDVRARYEDLGLAQGERARTPPGSEPAPTP